MRFFIQGIFIHILNGNGKFLAKKGYFYLVINRDFFSNGAIYPMVSERKGVEYVPLQTKGQVSRLVL